MQKLFPIRKGLPRWTASTSTSTKATSRSSALDVSVQAQILNLLLDLQADLRLTYLFVAPSGCYFHPRCPHAIERCRAEAPAWREISHGRFVGCHRAEELTLAGVE